MTFTEMLNKTIKESGLTNKEIIARCKELGEPITANYLSILKNDNTKIPSEKVALVLAKACNADYENILLIQAYLDKAPQPIKEFIEAIKKAEIDEAKEIMKELNQENTKESIEELEKMSLATFVCDYLKELKENPEAPKETMKIISEVIERAKEKDKKWALIKLTPNTPIKYLTDEEIKNLK